MYQAECQRHFYSKNTLQAELVTSFKENWNQANSAAVPGTEPPPLIYVENAQFQPMQDFPSLTLILVFKNAGCRELAITEPEITSKRVLGAATASPTLE